MKRWLMLLLLLCARGASAAQVIDDRGIGVDLPRPPQRVISMLPSLTETVCALGACDRLVGVDTFSNWPEAVGKLPHVGGLEDANIESIVALRPDVVLLATSSRAIARLEGLGIKVLALEPRTLADLQRVIGTVARVLDSGNAAQLTQRIDADLAAAADKLPAGLRGTRVYFEVNSAPYAASESSFIGELMARLGVANIVPGRLGPFPKLNPEFVVRADPQVIMVSDRNHDALARRPGWGRIAAVRTGRVCLFDPQQGDVLVRAGPRVAEGLQLMAQCLTGKLQQRTLPSPLGAGRGEGAR